MEIRAMRRKKRKIIISILCVICICMMNSKRIYAMEPLNEQIEEKLISSNAKEYEMNIVLEDIVVKRFYDPPYSMDEWEDETYVADEPLGEYSLEKLKEYTDEDFRAEFKYCVGYVNDYPLLIQIAKIYKSDEIYILDFRAWLGVSICYNEYYYADPDDFRTRMEGNENYDK